MKKRLLRTVPMLLIAVVASAPHAFGQRRPFEDRGFIVVNGGYQFTGQGFDRTTTLRVNAEDGSFTTQYDVQGGPGFDVAGGARVWRRLAVGAGFARFSTSTPATLNGSVPHPFVFNQLRTVSGDVGDLKREELIVDVQARITAPMGRRMEISGFGGPSFFQVKQEIVSTFTWTEFYPFDEATFGNATTVDAKGSKIGFHAGVDVAYYVTRNVGVGATLQFSSTTLDVESGDVSQEVKAGGARAGVGLRLKF